MRISRKRDYKEYNIDPETGQVKNSRHFGNRPAEWIASFALSFVLVSQECLVNHAISRSIESYHLDI